VSVALLIALGFVLGSIPFGVMLARTRGVDIRQSGSGNIGATNVARVLGARAGLVVLALDATKGAFPTWLALHHAPCRWVVAAVGFASIVGHCFSPWLRFRGGKGVATALGVFAMLSPQVAVGGIAVFALVVGVTRVPALGSLGGASAIAAILVGAGPLPDAVLAITVLCLLVYTHRKNLLGLFYI
jgi:glycerol-3-phosphate acyltransferase PlsY